MPTTATGGGESSAVRWLRGLWEYYREYTQTAVHAASAAALTAFGLLIFVNRFFVLLAIASYIFPPVLLYSLDSEIGKTTRTQSGTEPDRQGSQTRANAGTGTRTESERNAGTRRDTGSRRHPDSDKSRGDADSDSDDGDTDLDSDGGDTDSDSDDGDSDSDSDDGDTDSDGDDGDSDSDGDDGDTDSDG
ncbi:hypothetical protein [Haladaptatus sp. CMAA 1911]|uniref:hypothetical protein n=1 Tax=unclassified Haladaptatus TaxID=2622732 RepID=UPI003754F4B9